MNKYIIIIAIIAGLIAIMSFTNCRSKNEQTVPQQPVEGNIKVEGIIFFTGNYMEAIEKAKAENKLVFLDAYASWCGPCNKMKRKTFTDKNVGDFFNKHFVSIAIDMEKGEGVQLSRLFGVDAYPTLIFIDANGQPIGKTVGYHNAHQLLEVGNKVIEIK